MPVELFSNALVARRARGRRDGLVLLAQIAAILAVAVATVALAGLPGGSVAETAREIVAGP